MAIAKIHSYENTSSNVKITNATVSTMNIATGKCALATTYLINSFTQGQVTVQFQATPLGGTAGSWTPATIAGATISTNGVTLGAKNREIRKHMTWEFYKDLLPLKYTQIRIRLTWTDGDSNTTLETITTTLDYQPLIINLKSTTFGSDTTPTFEFDHPIVLKELKAKPVLEYGSNSKLDSIDHTITTFKYHNGTAYVAGNATTGETVSVSSSLKLQMTASSAMSGVEYYRIRLVPVSFT